MFPYCRMAMSTAMSRRRRSAGRRASGQTFASLATGTLLLIPAVPQDTIGGMVEDLLMAEDRLLLARRPDGGMRRDYPILAYCPRCLAGDSKPYFRRRWRLAPLRRLFDAPDNAVGSVLELPFSDRYPEMLKMNRALVGLMMIACSLPGFGRCQRIKTRPQPTPKREALVAARRYGGGLPPYRYVTQWRMTDVGIRRPEQAMLWAKAYHRAVVFTFSMPPTRNRVSPRLRACALAHAALAARCL
jgi:hypothetical protein